MKQNCVVSFIGDYDDDADDNDDNYYQHNDDYMPIIFLYKFIVSLQIVDHLHPGEEYKLKRYPCQIKALVLLLAHFLRLRLPPNTLAIGRQTPPPPLWKQNIVIDMHAMQVKEEYPPNLRHVLHKSDSGNVAPTSVGCYDSNTLI